MQSRRSAGGVRSTNEASSTRSQLPVLKVQVNSIVQDQKKLSQSQITRSEDGYVASKSANATLSNLRVEEDGSKTITHPIVAAEAEAELPLELTAVD